MLILSQMWRLIDWFWHRPCETKFSNCPSSYQNLIPPLTRVTSCGFVLDYPASSLAIFGHEQM